MERCNTNTQQPAIKEKIIIVYDKLTKPIALSMKNSINKHSCAIWSEKHYKDNEPKLTNYNNLILLCDKITDLNLANPKLKHKKYIDGIDLIVEGKTLGLKYNSETCNSTPKEILKKNWGKYLAGVFGPIVLIGGIPLAIIIPSYMFISEKKRIKVKLLFDAKEKFMNESLENFLNGELG